MSHVSAGELASQASVVDSALAGDESAFARLIAENHGPMIRVAYVITGDMESAADAVQSAWGICWRRLNGLRDRTQIRSWLVAIAANEARRARRRDRRAIVVDISHAIDEKTAPDPGDSISLVDLKRVLAQLNPDDQMLLALRFVGHLESSEIATHLRLSPSGVRSRLARLLDRMRFDLDLREGGS
jgi:RNA polymerase sigma-70 factor (ECF subfamily)